MNELADLWETKINKSLKRIYIAEDELLNEILGKFNRSRLGSSISVTFVKPPCLRAVSANMINVFHVMLLVTVNRIRI